MRINYKIKTYQHGERGASASVFVQGVEVHRTTVTKGDLDYGHEDGSDRRAAMFAAREWIRENREDLGQQFTARVRNVLSLSLMGV